MDTNRIIINNYDLSTTYISTTTARCGFTVVNSKKGPHHPVRLSAGSTALEKLFGNMKEDPSIYEAASFLQDYDLYVSSASEYGNVMTTIGLVDTSGKVYAVEMSAPLLDKIFCENRPDLFDMSGLPLNAYERVTSGNASNYQVESSSSFTSSEPENVNYYSFNQVSLNETLKAKIALIILPVPLNTGSYSKISFKVEGRETFKINDIPYNLSSIDNSVTTVMSQAHPCYLIAKDSFDSGVSTTELAINVGQFGAESSPITSTLNEASMWEEAQSPKYDDVEIFFKSTSISQDTTDNFFSLASYHTTAGFIFNETPDLATLSSTSTGLSLLSYGSNYWNICNKAIVNNVEVLLTGHRARMQCRIIDKAFGGAAPMFLNNGEGVGGQFLPSSTNVNVKYSYTKNQIDELEANNYNPFINDRTYGVMLVGQKTCKSGELTDWSYIGHTCSFLVFQREVKENIMIPQLGKPNNDFYRDLRKQQVDQILARRITGNNRIWAAAVCDTSTAEGVNDIIAQRARKFIINVAVKVDVFSEKVELNFTNVDQSVNL